MGDNELYPPEQKKMIRRHYTWLGICSIPVDIAMVLLNVAVYFWDYKLIRMFFGYLAKTLVMLSNWLLHRGWFPMPEKE